MTTTIGYEELSGFVQEAFIERGVPKPDAAAATDVIVSANLKGIDTHGVVRLPHYVRRLENGTVKARPDVTVESRAPAVAVVDGDDGLGHVVMKRAVDRAVEIAQTVGVASVAVKGSSHFGTAGYYVEQLTRHGCAGMVTTSSDAFQAPFGAAASFFGTNPIALGFPTSGVPLILDMATTSVPFGKLALAKAEGRPIPAEWGIDAQGHPTTDPNSVVGLHPIAGPKGSGLAAVIDVFSNLFVGAAWGPHIVKMYGDMDKPRRLGHFLTAWRIDAYLELRDFLAQIDTMIAELHALPTAEGFDRLYYPGELEAERAARRRENGIPIEPGLADELRELAARLGIDSPL